MSALRISLFGKFRAMFDEQPIAGLDSRKVQGLFCYLLLHRDRPHARETLAGLLYGDHSTAQSKKYLRQTVWHLQSALAPTTVPLLLVEPEWIQVNPHADFQFDVATFECAFAQAQGTAGVDLDAQNTHALQAAVELYQDDLLVGWYQDWCLRERERLQHIYLSMVDKLMSDCETRHDYACGLAYGEKLLRHDRAHERTHRRMMRLFYLQGDRTAALRQYDHCVTALQEELGVQPAERTRAVYEKIRAHVAQPFAPPTSPPPADDSPLTHILTQLKRLQSVLHDTQEQVQCEIQVVEQSLKRKT